MYSRTQETPFIERVTLERFKFHAQSYVDTEFMQDTEVEHIYDMIARQSVIRFHTDILGQKLESVKYPANWKEAFKERWFPKWALKKYPVKYSTIEVKALYPQLKLPREQYRPVFHVMKQMPRWEE